MTHRHLMDLPRRIEPDASLLMEWWLHTGIAELGGMTPRELVETGQEASLEAFLISILRGERDSPS